MHSLFLRLTIHGSCQISCYDVMKFGRVYENKTGQAYSKADDQLYEKICKYGDEEKAIQIAQQKQKQCIREGKKKPSEMCPCTTVYELMRNKLFSENLSYEF